MSLKNGGRFGPYEIVSLLGVGGMGEVYRARDTKLNRDVAVKTLPDIFAQDSERLSRFQREAQVLASLNHPNIAQIYGFEESDGARCIVMELVEGETLQERLRRGAIPVSETLALARQIADALEAAHEKGIVHRDLKPANIKITPEGRVKVLDFGLAKALESSRGSEDFSNSPTISMAGTQPGIILGTAAYMSPEQARGRPTDRLSDIWAYGCVLYEMLTARQAFSGETLTDILGRIVTIDPDWTKLPSATPPSVRSLLMRCLQKDRKRRLKDIVDASVEIEDFLSEHAKSASQAAVAPAIPVSKKRERLAWSGAALFLVAAAVSVPFAILHIRESTPEARAIRFTLTTPEKVTVLGTPPAISPDGRRVAFIGSFEGRTQIWLRSIDSLTAQPLSGTDGADVPFWSPDSKYIAFFAGGKLKKIEASGGPPQTLCDAATGRGGSWNEYGDIIFAPTAVGTIYRVSSSGGKSTPVTALDVAGGETFHRGPSFLPDGRHFLFFATGATSGIYVGSLDSKDRSLLLNISSTAAYVSPGYLFFVKERSLMAQRLDAKTLQLAGEAFPVAEPVGFYAGNNIATFSVSNNGVLAYGNGGGERRLAWFDRSGTLIDRIGPAWTFFDVALAPDLKRAAVQLSSPNQDIAVVDLLRGVVSRLTSNPAVDDFPVWSPDGSHVLFNSTRKGVADIYQKASSGAGDDELVFASNLPKNPTDWSRDGQLILFEVVDPKNRNDIWVYSLRDKKAEPYLQTSFAEQHARFSPDGKWVAYVSDENGADQVYVQSFPPSGKRVLASTGGGYTPRWRGDGKELFYLSSDRKIMSVQVKTDASGIEVSSPTVLFDAPVDAASAVTTNRFDVTPDGQRFLLNGPAGDTTSAITVVVNWLTGVTGSR